MLENIFIRYRYIAILLKIYSIIAIAEKNFVRYSSLFFSDFSLFLIQKIMIREFFGKFIQNVRILCKIALVNALYPR